MGELIFSTLQAYEPCKCKMKTYRHNLFVFILWLKKRSFLGLERSIFGANAHFAECSIVWQIPDTKVCKETNHPIDEPNRFSVDSLARWLHGTEYYSVNSVGYMLGYRRAIEAIVDSSSKQKIAEESSSFFSCDPKLVNYRTLTTVACCLCAVLLVEAVAVYQNGFLSNGWNSLKWLHWNKN